MISKVSIIYEQKISTCLAEIIVKNIEETIAFRMFKILN
jgi:hypothetical protein